MFKQYLSLILLLLLLHYSSEELVIIFCQFRVRVLWFAQQGCRLQVGFATGDDGKQFILDLVVVADDEGSRRVRKQQTVICWRIKWNLRAVDPSRNWGLRLRVGGTS